MGETLRFGIIGAGVIGPVHATARAPPDEEGERKLLALAILEVGRK